jgi:hypothetical protein
MPDTYLDWLDSNARLRLHDRKVTQHEKILDDSEPDQVENNEEILVDMLGERKDFADKEHEHFVGSSHAQDESIVAERLHSLGVKQYHFELRAIERPEIYGELVDHAERHIAETRKHLTRVRKNQKKGK